MKKKTIALLLIAVMLFGTAVGGTLAYLLDSDVVVNTFTVGKINLTLDETEVNTDGIAVDGADRVAGNEYHLIPGQTYVKDPTVHIEPGSELSYIRMLVTITDLTDVKAAFGVADGEYFLPENFVNGWDPAVWVSTKTVVEKDNIAVYEFRYHTTVKNEDKENAKDLAPLFTGFTVPGELDNEDVKGINDMKIIVNAHAIQAAGFSDADAAWAAFDQQVNP